MRPAPLLAATFLLLAGSLPAQAQPQWRIERAYQHQAEFCPCCQPDCVKPWVLPDRWDDETTLSGHGAWAGNGIWDHEPFDDFNANRLHDPGEPFADTNANSQYDEEYYHPFNTGYVASKDAGRPLVLKPGSPDGTLVAGHYNAVDFSDATHEDATGNRYEWDIRECSYVDVGPGHEVRYHPGNVSGPTRRGIEALVAMDPDAYYDPVSGQVVTTLPRSPRAVFLGLADPRVGDQPRDTAIIAKAAAFFIEGIDTEGNVIGLFVRLQSPNGRLCPPDYPVEAAFISSCPE